MTIRPAKTELLKLRRNSNLVLTRDASVSTGKYEINIRRTDEGDDGDSMTPHEARSFARALQRMADHVDASNAEAE